MFKTVSLRYQRFLLIIFGFWLIGGLQSSSNAAMVCKENERKLPISGLCESQASKLIPQLARILLKVSKHTAVR